APSREDLNKKNGASSTAPVDQRDCWETWADEKSTRAVEAKPEPRAERAEPVEAPAEERPAKAERHPRKHDDERPAKAERHPRKHDDERPAKAERHPRKHDDERPAKKDAPAPAAAAAAADPGSQVRIHVNLGKKHGLAADDIRKLLGDAAGIPASSLGSVAMRDTYCHVRVPATVADQIIATVSGQTHGDTAIKVELAHA
nr:DbpA RNA binding domain-containing protein [Kofleriaceae bacterium]